MKLFGWKEESTPRVAIDLEDKSIIVCDTPIVTLKTPYEELVAKINEENKSPEVTEKNLKRDIFREIMSVYFWMRTELNMKHRPIRVDEFEVIKEVIYKTARQLPNYSHPISECKDTCNYQEHFVIRRGYFSVGCSYDYMLNVRFFQKAQPILNYGYFDLESQTVAGYIKDDRYSIFFPPNIFELMNEIYEKRYPDSAETTPRP